MKIWPTRSETLRDELNISLPLLTVPEYTRKNDSSPTPGSFMVLKT